MKRGEVYYCDQARVERGGKTGYYVVVSRNFIADYPGVATVVGAPVYSQVLGIDTEVVIGPEQGVLQPSSVRCDLLTLLLKERLRRVGQLSEVQIPVLDQALAVAMGLSGAQSP